MGRACGKGFAHARLDGRPPLCGIQRLTHDQSLWDADVPAGGLIEAGWRQVADREYGQLQKEISKRHLVKVDLHLISVSLSAYNGTVVLLDVPVAQLDRALASGAKGCGFNSRQAHHFKPTSMS